MNSMLKHKFSYLSFFCAYFFRLFFMIIFGRKNNRISYLTNFDLQDVFNKEELLPLNRCKYLGTLLIHRLFANKISTNV